MFRADARAVIYRISFSEFEWFLLSKFDTPDEIRYRLIFFFEDFRLNLNPGW